MMSKPQKAALEFLSMFVNRALAEEYEAMLNVIEAVAERDGLQPTEIEEILQSYLDVGMA